MLRTCKWLKPLQTAMFYHLSTAQMLSHHPVLSLATTCNHCKPVFGMPHALSLCNRAGWIPGVIQSAQNNNHWRSTNDCTQTNLLPPAAGALHGHAAPVDEFVARRRGQQKEIKCQTDCEKEKFRTKNPALSDWSLGQELPWSTLATRGQYLIRVGLRFIAPAHWV